MPTKKYRRYSLIALDPKTNYRETFGIDIDKLNIKVFKDGKTTLAEIDKYTMQFENIDELETDLFNRNIIDVDVMFFIEYKQKHKYNGRDVQKRQTDVLYASDSWMKPFTDELSTYVNEYSEHFGKFYQEMLDIDFKCLKFLYEYGYVSKTLYTSLYDAKRFKMSDLETRELKNQLTNYKTIRNIHIGTKKFKNNIYEYEGNINREVGTTIADTNDMIDDFISSSHIHL